MLEWQITAARKELIQRLAGAKQKLNAKNMFKYLLDKMTEWYDRSVPMLTFLVVAIVVSVVVCVRIFGKFCGTSNWLWHRILDIIIFRRQHWFDLPKLEKKTRRQDFPSKLWQNEFNGPFISKATTIVWIFNFELGHLRLTWKSIRWDHYLILNIQMQFPFNNSFFFSSFSQVTDLNRTTICMDAGATGIKC